MLRKLFARPHQEEIEDADSVAPFITRRSRSGEASAQRLGDEEMPDSLREQWKQLRRKHEGSSVVGFLRKAADTFREDYEPPPSFTQFVLVTLKDETLPYDISSIFDLLQLCIARDRSRVCLQSDTAEIVVQSYRRYFATFQEQPTAENCEVFFHAGQALYALGLLALVHLSDSQVMGKVRDEAVVWLQAGLMAINTEVGLQKVASTQFVCFSTGRVISQCFRPQFPQVDLSLVLLSHLLTLTQSSSNLPATLRAVLPHQLRSLQAGFLTVEPCHLLCLLDKTLVTLYFLTTEMRHMRNSAVLENCEMLSCGVLSFCWTCMKWAGAEQHERLIKLFALLEQIYVGLAEAGEELIPLKLLQPMEEWGAVEGEVGRDMHEQVMKLVGNYLKRFSEARVCDVVLRSGFLSVLLSPFFLLNSSSLETQAPALRLVLLSRDGRTQFLQEFIKGFHQYKDQLSYVSKLSSLLSELVAEEREWVNLLSEQHLMDYLYQVLLETDLQPLQVCVTSLLRVPKLAASLLEQPSVLHTAVRFLGSDFGLELWARFLSCNASDRAYRHFVRLLSKEQSERQVRQLFCTLEIALESQGRAQSQAMFIKHSVLKVAVKRLGDFAGTGLTLVALPALRLLLYRCASAQAQLRTLGFTPLKKELLAALDCLQLPEQAAELESLLDNLLFMLLDSTDLRTVTVVRLPELAEVVLRAVLRLSEEAQLRYISTIHSICSLQVNALSLSNEGAIKPALHLFSITPNTPIRCLLLDILTSMMKESLRPCDLVALIQCLNDDSKASYPSKLTKDLLELLKKTFETQEEIGWRFEVQPGGYLEANAAFPRKKGCTVFLWLQLKAPTSPRLLLSLTHSFPGQQLYLRVAPSGALTASLSAAGNTQTFDCGLLPWAKLTLISVTLSTKKELFKVAVDGQTHECRLSEGRIQESAFECMRIGNSDGGFEGQVAGCGLFLTALSCPQLEELQGSGPTFFTTLLEQQVNYLTSIRCSRLAEAELAVCLHPAYILDAEHAVNVARKSKSLDATMIQESGQELTGNPLLRSVIAVPRTRVSEALSCVGGLPVLFPLLSRVEKKHHVKEILHQLLEITTQYCRFSSTLAGEHLIATLRLRLESVAKRFPLKTSTAILLNHLKDALLKSKQLQQTMVLSLILNQTIWEKSKRTVRKLLILVNYSSIFQSDEERVTLISRLIRFAVPDVESSSDYAANVRKMVKTYAEEGEARFYELLVTELLEALVEQEDQEAVVSLLLKLLVFLSKRGKVSPSEKLMLVLLYLLDKDREKARNYTKKVLYIVKLAYCKSKIDPSVLSTLLPALNQHLKACLAPCDFQALLSLMICVPSLSPSVSFALPELPIKSSFTTVLSTYEDVILRHPQVMDLITHRLAAYPSQQALEDFVRIAECQPQAVFDQTSFPDWTLPLLCAGQQTELLGRLVGVSCGRAMLQTQGAWKKCARLFDILCSEQQIPLLERLTKETLEVMEETGELMEKSQVCRDNLHYFSYLIEDFSAMQQGRIDRNLVLGFVQVISKAKLLSDTQPSVPAISIGEAMKCYKFDNIRGRFDPREGGTLRIALTVLFQSFRYASDSELAQLLTFLKLFLKPFPGKQRSASIVDPKIAKIDLLSSSDFVSCLIFAELSDILISRRSEESVITVLSAVLQGLNDYSGLIGPLERLSEGLSLEDHYDTKQFLQVYGAIRLGSGRESTRPAQNAGWWERDSFEITKLKLKDKVQVVLRPAFSSGALGRILLTEDWVESVHPFYLLSSSSLLACSASPPSNDEPIVFTAPRKLTSPFLPDLSVEIPRIAKARFQMRKAEECDYLYQHTQWHTFKKWQTREAGLWVRSHPNSIVWKLDPEMDLEYRSLRLKAMQGRIQGYYQDKAHKKTISQLNQVVAKRRFSRDGIQPITPSRPLHTQTVLITNESPESLFELLLLKADSCPPSTPTQSTQTLPAPGKGQHECERIQAKGASFGSLELTSRYLIFRSTGACKCDTRDYFGSAPVPFT